MKKEWVLTIVSSVLAISIALGLTKWLAPQLLGGSADMQLVQIDKKIPPFFEGVFRKEDQTTNKFLLQDPVSRVRAKPLFPDMGHMGPHDLLGFRNRAVPNVADLIVIGDSQTYGNNATLENSWPGHLTSFLGEQADVYSMATGGWGAVQYLDMFTKATVFQPKVVVVAFYTGNDPLESFLVTYGVEKWKTLIPDSSLTSSDAPKVVFPAPKSTWWPVKFSDGVKTVFSPTLRLSSNQDHPAVNAGYKIMSDVAKRIVKMAGPFNVQVVFTVIPTKELVYATKVEKDKLDPPEDYKKLVNSEIENIGKLLENFRSLPGATYIDVVRPLQKAAMNSKLLYPEDTNGHPIDAGYQVIAEVIAKEVKSLFPLPPRGLVGVLTDNTHARLAFVEGRNIRYFKSSEIATKNGWSLEDLPLINKRGVATLKVLSDIDVVDPAKYGPK